MAPIRRYLRITKYSVLECRIYLDNPALVQTWLLNPRNPVLPRVIESVRPLVLPKLREERERSRKKSTKKRGIKDVVVEDDFEVSIFLTETNTRHSLLFKHKHFRDTTQTKLTSNSDKLTGATRDEAIDVDGEVLQQVGGSEVPGLRREENDEDDATALDDIPTAVETEQALETRVLRRRTKRRFTVENGDDEGGDYAKDQSDEDGAVEVIDDDSSASEDDHVERPSKRRKESTANTGQDAEEEEEQQDDKKKMGMDISYEGFSIYGRVLCLVVKRREGGASCRASVPPRASSNKSQTAAPAGQAMMENWITSTQMPAAAVAEELEG